MDKITLLGAYPMAIEGWRNVPEVSPAQLAPFPIFASYWVASNHLKIPVFQLTGIQTMLILEGQVLFRSWDPDGRLWTGQLRAGDLFSFFPGRLQYERTANQVVRWYQTMYGVAAGPLQSGVPFLEGIGRMPQLVNVGGELPAVCRLYDRLIAALHFRPATWRLETAAALTELIQTAFQCTNRSPILAPRKIDFWDALLVRLEEDPKVAVADLAVECHMSVNHFIRQFRQHVGTTPKQYLLTRRLWKARGLLQGGALVKAAASRVGFDDQLHFSRQYRKLFGAPPSRQSALPLETDSAIARGLPVGRHIWADGFGMHSIPNLGPVAEP